MHVRVRGRPAVPLSQGRHRAYAEVPPKNAPRPSPRLPPTAGYTGDAGQLRWAPGGHIEHRQAWPWQPGGVSATEPALPFVLAGLTVRVGMSRFFGSFTVESGCLTFEASQGVINEALNIEPAKALFHTDASVTVVWGRFLPPWLNTGVILIDHRQAGSRATGVLQMPTWHRRPLVAAFRNAGFVPEVFCTRTSMGGQIGSDTELICFRSTHRPMSRSLTVTGPVVTGPVRSGTPSPRLAIP